MVTGPGGSGRRRPLFLGVFVFVVLVQVGAEVFVTVRRPLGLLLCLPAGSILLDRRGEKKIHKSEKILHHMNSDWLQRLKEILPTLLVRNASIRPCGQRK